MGVAVPGMLALGALFRFTAIGLQMRAVVESPRMTELNGIRADRVSAFAWALSSVFAGMAGVLIAPRFNTLAAAGLLQPGRGGHRRRGAGPARQPARRAAGGLGAGHLHRPARHLPAPMGPTTRLAGGRSRTTSPRRCRSSCSSACWCCGRRSGAPARPLTRWRASTPRRRRWRPPTRSPRPDRGHPGCSRSCFFGIVGWSSSSGPTSRGCSSSPRR